MIENVVFDLERDVAQACGQAALVNVQTTLKVRDWGVVQVYSVRLTAQCNGANQAAGANS